MKLVPITLDKDRTLKFGVRSFVAIEKELNTTMDKIDFSKQETIYVMLYAGLIHADKKLTLDKVYDIVEKKVEKLADEENLGFMESYAKVLEEIGTKVGEALGDNPSN